VNEGLNRRAALALGLATVGATAARAGALLPAKRRLAFEVWRGGHRIGRHTLAFDGGETSFVVRIEAVMAVALGPITLFRYHHQATETWRDGRFVELTSHTLTNGKAEQVSAIRASTGVLVKTGKGAHVLPVDTLPLTHWNQHALSGPLFNPETGAVMRERVSRQEGQTLRPVRGGSIAATRYTLAGDADIVDWYDAEGSWAALQGKVKDGSLIDYRRV